MQTFKDIAHYYLGTRLLLSDTYDNGRNTDFLGISIDEEMLQFTLNGGDVDWGNITAFKPLLRPLSSLTKPITVEGYNDGKEFIPKDKFYGNPLDYTVDRLPFSMVQLLLKWHFNVFNLPETEYIKID